MASQFANNELILWWLRCWNLIKGHEMNTRSQRWWMQSQKTNKQRSHTRTLLFMKRPRSIIWYEAWITWPACMWEVSVTVTNTHLSPASAAPCSFQLIVLIFRPKNLNGFTLISILFGHSRQLLSAKITRHCPFSTRQQTLQQLNTRYFS